MTASIGNLILFCLLTYVVPVLTGGAVCAMLHMRATFPHSFFAGYMISWASFQILAVLLVIARASFLVVVVVYSVILLALSIYGIVKKAYRDLRFWPLSPREWIAMAVISCAVLAIMVLAYRFQLTDADDSRFVVNAVDTVRTNRMLLTDVNTGAALTTWTGSDLYKDVIAPWPVYMAYISKVTGVYVTSVMHTYFPPVLMLLFGCALWLLSGELFRGRQAERAGFVCMTILLYVYGYYSIYGTETFTLTRIWQGKAILAAVGIPALFYEMFALYRLIPACGTWRSHMKISGEARGHLVLLWITVFALSLLSSMSDILTVIFLGCFGLIYGLCKKSPRVACMIWTGCLIGAAYLLISTQI